MHSFVQSALTAFLAVNVSRKDDKRYNNNNNDDGHDRDAVN